MKTHPSLRILRVTLLLLGLLPGQMLWASPQEGAPKTGGLSLEVETYTLPNGLTVHLYEDHALPKVVINTWFAVGSKDEELGRSGFAHLFEHLMFMGTGRVPDNQFDVLMERGGGSNNASTSQDRTNYYSQGPSSLLPTLLWLDADRLDALANHMTQEKLDRQRAVVRNERRQTSENVPYGRARLVLPKLLYPEDHPYHHTVIGSHEDLEAAELQDVVDFFHTFYVPSNASLVVAGDFDSEEVKALIESTFGAIQTKPSPRHATADPVTLAHEKRALLVDKVRVPKLILAWHSPAFYRDGDGEMDLVGSILGGGPSSRLEKRLVKELGLAQTVAAYQVSGELGSSFRIEAVAAPGQDLERIKREILAVVEGFVSTGPDADELARAKTGMEARFLQGQESLLARADQLNAYYHFFGHPDSFQRDLERWTNTTPEGLREWAARVFVDGRVDLRILPESTSVAAASLEVRPADFSSPAYEPPVPQRFELSNGIAVYAAPRPKTRLFSGALLVRGGEGLFAPEQSGLGSLTARMLNSGAGGLDAGAFADAVEALGGSLVAGASPTEATIEISGLTSRLSETLDLFADLVLRPNLLDADLKRERKLALAAIQAFKDDPSAVAAQVARAQLYGLADARGRSTLGTAESVSSASLDDVRDASERMLHPENATFCFVGDFEVETLRAELEARFGTWAGAAPAETAPRGDWPQDEPGRMLLVDRPGAPQTVLYLIRRVPRAEGVPRAARQAVDVIFGGTFTSRLNANLREDKGYTYGAGSRIREERGDTILLARSSVRTDATGAALSEFKREFERMARAGVDEDELSKALETARRRLVERVETTRAAQNALEETVLEEQPLDATAQEFQALAGVDAEGANRVAKSGLYDWNELTIVLVGDREAVLPQLEANGFARPLEADSEGRIKP